MSCDASACRLPPYSEEAERAVLGSLLLDFARVANLCAVKAITEDSFYVPAHRLLFEHLGIMQAEHRTIDLLTVGERMKDSGRLDQAGGHAFLEGLIDSTPTSAHAEYYIDILSDKQRRRKIIGLAAGAMDRCYGETPVAEVAAELSQAVVSAVDVRKPADKESLVEESLALFDAAHSGRVSGVPLPWPDFSQRVGGIQRRCVCPLLGRDGKGKSMLIARWLLFLGQQGITALSFPMEDGADRQMRRMAACLGGYSTTEMETGFVQGVDGWSRMDDFTYDTRRKKAEDSLRQVAALPVYFEDGYYTAEQIAALCANHRRQHGIQIGFIDGVKDVVPTRGENATKQEEHISRIFVQMAKDLDIAVVPVCHLSDIPDGQLIARRNLRGAKSQFQNARQVLIYQDAGFSSTNFVLTDSTVGLHMEKNNYGRETMLFLDADFDVCDFRESMRIGGGRP